VSLSHHRNPKAKEIIRKKRSGLSDTHATPSTTNTSDNDLLHPIVSHNYLEPLQHSDEGEQAEEDEDEPFVYPGATEEPPPVEETQIPAETPVAPPSLVQRDPSQLEEIYAAAVSGDLPSLQELFQSAVASGTGNTEAFVLANDASPRTGLTPLHGAASRGHLEVVQWREYFPCSAGTSTVELIIVQSLNVSGRSQTLRIKKEKHLFTRHRSMDTFPLLNICSLPRGQMFMLRTETGGRLSTTHVLRAISISFVTSVTMAPDRRLRYSVSPPLG